MIKLNEDIIEQIYKECKPLALFQVGSSIVCKNPNDVDILLVYRNQEDFDANAGSVRKHYSDGKYRYEVFSNTVGQLEIDLRTFMYEGGQYLKLLKGNLDTSIYDIFKNKTFRRQTLELLLDRICLKKFNGSTDNSYACKPYRLLMSCYMLDNGEYKLTRKQVTILNEVHNAKEMSQELWDYCEEVVIRLIKQMNKEDESSN